MAASRAEVSFSSSLCGCAPRVWRGMQLGCATALGALGCSTKQGGSFTNGFLSSGGLSSHLAYIWLRWPHFCVHTPLGRGAGISLSSILCNMQLGSPAGC